jgi:alpha-L-fucosidase
LKFGALICWGTYCQWGATASWTLHPTQGGQRPKDKTYQQYVEDYENLKKSFNPVQFNPDKWAVALKDAGMKYMVFVTKHHDGFCMFDTKQTDYGITSPDCPFHTNSKANITKEVFKAFAKEHFKIGAYYSISDWHHNDYICKDFSWEKGGPNYDIKQYPEKFARFNDFTNNQLAEIASSHKNIDIFWFDGADPKVDKERIKTTIRKEQPQTLMVARGWGGQYENYETPENVIPPKALDYPWETCVPLNSWSYSETKPYRSTQEVVKWLMQIVSRGGNLLLGFGPGPDGDFHPDTYKHIKEIGDWIKVNGEAIYGTRKIAPYEEGNIVFTQKGENVFATYLPENKEQNPPAEITLHSFLPEKGGKIFMLGVAEPLEWKSNGNSFTVAIPDTVQKQPPCGHAWVLKLNAMR